MGCAPGGQRCTCEQVRSSLSRALRSTHRFLSPCNSQNSRNTPGPPRGVLAAELRAARCSVRSAGVAASARIGGTRWWTLPAACRGGKAHNFPALQARPISAPRRRRRTRLHGGAGHLAAAWCLAQVPCRPLRAGQRHAVVVGVAGGAGLAAQLPVVALPAALLLVHLGHRRAVLLLVGCCQGPRQGGRWRLGGLRRLSSSFLMPPMQVWRAGSEAGEGRRGGGSQGWSRCRLRGGGRALGLTAAAAAVAPVRCLQAPRQPHQCKSGRLSCIAGDLARV